MTASPSLTRRLIWTLTLGACVLWLVAALLAAGTLRSRLDEAFDGGLRETAERLLSLAEDSLHDEGIDVTGRPHGHEVPPLDDVGDEYIVYQLRKASGEILLRSKDAPAEAFAVPLVEGFADSGPWRIYTIGTMAGDSFIQVAESNAHRADTLWSSILALLWPIALLVPLSALGIYLAVRSALRPVREFSAEVAGLRPANLAPVGNDRIPSELQPVASAVNGLIDRLSAALEAERNFAANSAHELRTPIAGSLAQTQRLIAELGDGPGRVRAQQIEASLLRLRHLAEKLLQLARVDAGIGVAAPPADLLPALRLLVDDLRRARPPAATVELEVAPQLELIAPMDVDAFGIALRNLLDNAGAHGAAAEPIVVTARPGMVEISNGGPLVPPAKLALLTSRFVRGATEAEGSGLGLAIVESIMRQGGGRLELRSPRPGQPDGFCARLILPS